MKIAIASGKGGTGKTTVAVNLAHMAAQDGRSVAYLDCDVEEPNGHIFLRPVIEQEQPIEKSIPVVDASRCTHCGLCAKACRYGAMASLPNQTLVFAELCHGCGGCTLACPRGAIQAATRRIGTLQQGRSEKILFVQGTLDVGEAMSPPAIRAVKAAAPPADLVLLDAPPGTSCPAVETIRGADLVLLVTEPTRFGLHDLVLAVELVQTLRLPMGVVINRADIGNGKIREYCDWNRIPILAEIPDQRAVAEAYSRGQMIAETVPGFGQRIVRLLTQIEGGTAPCKKSS